MAEVKLTYHIRMEQPSTHYFKIELHVENINDELLELSMPAWTPGSYLIREYAKNVEAVTAKTTTGSLLPVKKTAKNKWQIATDGNYIIVSYAVYAFEESVRTCLLDEEHASIIPAGLFLYPEQFDLPSTLIFYPPPGWNKISTSLDMADGDPWKRTAPDKDILFDSPVEIGNHAIFRFTAANVEHELAIYGPGNYHPDKLVADLQKIVEEEVKIFRHHPCKNYLFILLNSNSFRGGLEHLFSTSLIFKRFNYEPELNYQEFLSLAAHEYFHLWNVKRLRPAALGPFNYGEENYTTSLWIAEGFTSYYDDLIVRRCNLMSERNFLDVLEKNINDTVNPPGNFVQPVAEASFDAWIKYYRQNENSPNATVNYYVKGSVLALLLDIMIIANSGGNNSLDDAIREAYEEFYVKQNRGYTEEEFKAILEKYTGENLSWFYNDHVFGTKQPDLKKYFDLVGIEMKDENAGKIEPDFGISISETNHITQIRKNSAGEKGGLNVNDEIIAVDDFRYTTNFLPTLLTNKKAGAKVKFTVSRSGMMKELSATIQITDKVSYKLSVKENSTGEQKKNYNKWLKV